MTQEKQNQWVLTEEGKRMIAEANREERAHREAYLDRAKQLEETLDATLVGVWIPRPGIPAGDPAVYRSKQDGSFFRVAGKKDEVATKDDPEEVQQRAKIRYRVPLAFVGEYAIVKFDLERKIKDGILFYTPEGYVNHRRYNPDSDPPLVTTQGNTPSPTM